VIVDLLGDGFNESTRGAQTLGRSLTGSARYATMPNSAIPAISRLVAMGRRMKTSEIFMDHLGVSRQRRGRSTSTHQGARDADMVAEADA
jgi:hypothetical protein